MGFSRFYVTNKGRSLLAKSQLGVTISFTRMQIGTGSLQESTDIEEASKLVTPLKDLPIAGKDAGAKSATIKAQLSNSGMDAFYWRELGLFATDPDEGEILYAYANAGRDADYIPAGSVSKVDFTFGLVVAFGNATQVSVSIDQSLVFATLEGLYAAKSEAIARAAADATNKADTAEENAKAASRPVTWMPTADEVGARPNMWVPSKSDIGLGNVDNTSDMSKPLSTAQATAIGAGTAEAIATAAADATLKANTAEANAKAASRPSTWMPTATDIGAADINLTNVTNASFKAKAEQAGGGGQKIYDQVIRTQAEFEALIASPTWLGAVSVCFVGDGGALKFTRSDGQGCKIPQTVKQIQGMNSAIIEVTNFSFNSTTNKAALWYEATPTTTEYWVDGMTVNCVGEVSSNYCSLRNCTQVSNCSGRVAGPSTSTNAPFRDCTRLSSCTSDCTNTGEGAAMGFVSCMRLINCVGINTSSNTGGAAFASCTQLSQCTGTSNGNGDKLSNGFQNCTQLSNCMGTGLNTGSSDGYGFYGCAYLVACKEGETPSKTALYYSNCSFISATLERTAIFDQVIRTQAEFEALIASPTWLGAVSVCFIGNGGTLKFTRSDGQGCKIPQTVKQIQGMNSATIEVGEFYSGSNAALWYETAPTTTDYWVNGMTVICSIKAHQLAGCSSFFRCTQLSNCTGTTTKVNDDCSFCAFDTCTKLINCTGTGMGGSYTDVYAFYGCTELVNCTGNVKGGDQGIGFSGCTQLINCIGTGEGKMKSHGFHGCTQLSNCSGTGTAGASGFGNGGWGFYDCSYLNGCKQGATASSSAFLGGTNTKVDTLTVVAS